MADSLSSLSDVSAAMREHAASNSVPPEQISASAANAENLKAMALYNKYLQEVDAADPTSTITGPQNAPFKPVYVTGKPETVIVMPDISSNNPPCYSESWWTRNLAPVPKRESDLSELMSKSNLSAGLSQKQVKFPPVVKDFPIKFDRFMNYKEFLS